MRIIKLNTHNLRPLEEELDRIGWEKYGIEPRLRTMPTTDFMDEELGFDYGDDDEFA